ncbi:MAG: aminodeoxychorismate synthase component I [Planctomycetes bacterium]|nr:aminodeoxychorismate synthase component I [Planctomycetota bacterium]
MKRSEPARVRAGLAGLRLPFALESGGRSGAQGRRSLYGAEPFATFESRRGGRPFAALRQFLKRTFRAGGIAVGYLAYDMGRHVERIPRRASDDLGFPECHFAAYGRVLELDHARGTARMLGRGPSAWKPRLDLPAPAPGPVRATSLSPNMTRAAFVRAVARAVRYVRAGDIFQVNLSRRFAARFEGAPADLWARLAAASPAPFAAWLDLGGRHVMSSSPERFLRVEGRRVETRPIKGTRPRGRTRAEDARLRRELRESDKDRAELAMIVDLERNDLGRVCRVGSVRVEEARVLEAFPQVHHGIATVAGELRADVDAVDLLRATFPGGSITGAPKVRAMEIIEELEPTRRSVYTGAIGWIARDGMDLSIAIRTILLEGEIATWQVGAGILAESDPEAEERETRAKACGIERALGLATEGR